MALLPVKTVLTRALFQLRRLSVVYPLSMGYTHAKILPDVGLSKPILLVPSNRGLHATTFTWTKKKDHGFSPGKTSEEDDRNLDITLLVDGGARHQVMTKFEAQKIANLRELRLVLVDETNPSMPTYKLMTGKELQEARDKVREQKRINKKKEPKMLRVTSKISKHDLEIKTKKMVEWLQKGSEVKISIKIKRAENDKAAVDVFKFVAESTKDISRVSQSQKSASELVCILTPKDLDTPKNPKVKVFTNDQLKAANKDTET